MPICESQNQTDFNASFVEFALPHTNEPETDACMMFDIINPYGPCIADNFNENKTITCDQHVYSPDIPYEFSLVEDLDLPKCYRENWPLEVILFSKFHLFIVDRK